MSLLCIYTRSHVWSWIPNLGALPFHAGIIVVCVVQAGYPFQLDFGGIACINQPGVHEFDITESALAASVNMTAFAFVSPVGNLMQALEALIQEPCGHAYGIF